MALAHAVPGIMASLAVAGATAGHGDWFSENDAGLDLPRRMAATQTCDAPEVTEVSKDQLENLAEAFDRPFAVLKFYKPTCPYCIKFQCPFQEFAASVEADADVGGKIFFGAVDCTAAGMAQLCQQQFGAPSVPTVLAGPTSAMKPLPSMPAEEQAACAEQYAGKVTAVQLTPGCPVGKLTGSAEMAAANGAAMLRLLQQVMGDEFPEGKIIPVRTTRSIE